MARMQMPPKAGPGTWRAVQLHRGWQTGRFPGFETAGHRVDVLITHFLQCLGGKCGSAAAAAMTNDHRVWVGSFFFDVELDGATTHVSRAGNVSFIPFVFVPDIDDDRLAIV